MNVMKSTVYVQETDFNILSKELIAGLDGRAKTVRGNRYSGRFVFARGRRVKNTEVGISLVEELDRKHSGMGQYTVYIIDGVKRGDDPQLFHTSDMTETGLTKLLREIWHCLVSNSASEEGENMETVAAKNALEVSAAPTHGRIDANAEFAYLRSYIEGCCLDDEVSEAFLLSLWVAYCLHQNLSVDSDEYEDGLTALWSTLVASDGGKPSHWEDFESFKNDMSRHLW